MEADSRQEDSRGRGRPYSVAVLSPCGWGNLGDAAIVASTLHAVRARLPGAEIVGLTLNPRDTAVRHQIPAYTCVGFSRPHYAVSVTDPFAAPGDAPEPGPNGGSAASRWGAVRAKLSELPAAGQLLGLAKNARAVPAELRHRRALRGATRGLRYVVVAGGGQLDDFWGGAWGHPYVLFRWLSHAKSVGAKGLILSVGTGSLTTPLARFYVTRALALADYRSFRDAGSRELVKSPLVANDPVVPDLAYGLPVPEGARRTPGARMVVGLSPIAYADPHRWPVADEERYRSYLKRLVGLAEGLLGEGFELVLYGTDRPDLHTVDVVRAELASRVAPDLMARVRAPRVETLDELFREMAGIDLLIASRLHGVLLAHLLAIPTLAISYERKVSTLMTTLGQESFCVGIDAFEEAPTLERFKRLVAERERRSADLEETVALFRAQVEAQYDRAFGPRPEAVP